MKVLVAMDSMKGSLSSQEANRAIAEGIRRVDSNAEVLQYEMADGGEGTLEALSATKECERIKIPVTGPSGEPVQASFVVLKREEIALIEMAQAAGLPLLSAEKRNPLYTTSFGVGEMIRHAFHLGIRKFIIGIGGSATNDAGIGMLQALGFDLLDEENRPVPFGALGVKKVQTISEQNVLSGLRECTFQVACDVTNPLCGERGCSKVFGPQKGADAKMVEDMDRWMKQFETTIRKWYPNATGTYPGSGAAGGMGYALRTFLHADLQPGISLVLQHSGMEQVIKDVDLVITGEGKLDGQTIQGKTPIGVARLAKTYDKKVIALCGVIGEGAEKCLSHGIDDYYSINEETFDLEKAMQKNVAYENLARTTEKVFRENNLAYRS